MVLEVILVVLGVVLVVLHGAQRQCSEQMFGTDVRNRQCSEQCSEPTQPMGFTKCMKAGCLVVGNSSSTAGSIEASSSSRLRRATALQSLKWAL